MGYNQNKRNYRMSDSELVDFVRVLCQCITRDIVEFGEFSVTAADVTALSNLAIQFNNLPDDEYVHQEYLAAVEEKNIIYEQLLSMTKKMATRIELHYGKNSSQYKKFNVSKLIVLNESEFVAQVGLLNQFLESHLAELASEGVTAALLTEYEELIAAFEAQRSVVSDLSIKRKDSTTVRIKKGNEIYDLVKNCFFANKNKTQKELIVDMVTELRKLLVLDLNSATVSINRLSDSKLSLWCLGALFDCCISRDKPYHPLTPPSDLRQYAVENRQEIRISQSLY